MESEILKLYRALGSREAVGNADQTGIPNEKPPGQTARGADQQA
jgi:hypothetical protein